jgi:hypothetical protein
MAVQDAAAVASLHEARITSFLSTLGGGFLKQLYAAIARSPSAFGFVWERADGAVLGFIACSENTGRLYKEALLRGGVRMAGAMIRFVLRPAFVKRMIETLRYPTRVGAEVPPAEILSMAVSPEAGEGCISLSLTRQALAEFKRRGVDAVKAGVGPAHPSMNRFYQMLGFEHVSTCAQHGAPMNILVIEGLTAGTAPGAGGDQPQNGSPR